MPYSIETDDGITVDGIPDHVAPDAPELKARVQQARTQRRMQSPEYAAKVEAQRARDREEYSPTRGMGPLELASANWSAGYGNLTQGLQQVLSKTGMVSPVSDEDIREKRERDEQLAQALPYVGRFYQGASEALPMMAIPAGAFARPIQALPYAGKAGPVTQLLAASAAGGATGAALSPTTSDESRGANMTLAAGLGAAIPAGGVAVPAGARGLRKLLTESGATQRAAEAIAEQMPERVRRDILERLAVRKPPTLKGEPIEVPTSATQATGDARLAQAEAYSRSRPGTQPGWADFDSARNAALFDTVRAQAPSELRLERLERARELKTGPMRESALAEASQLADIASPVTMHAQQLLEGASGANPAVQTVAKYVARELGADAAGAVTPARLYEVRKVLAAKLSGPGAMTDELSAAAKGAQRETRGLIEAIDETLDSASRGEWRPYLQEYGARSKPIKSGEAQREVLERIEQKPLRGNTPEVTAAGYGQALRTATQSKYGDKLTPEARSDAAAFLDHLRQAEAASRTRKGAATMGGGSITNTDQQLARLTSRVVAALPGVGGYAKRITEHNIEQVEREMARLLQSPTELGAALRALPADQRRQVLDEALRASGLAGAESATP